MNEPRNDGCSVTVALPKTGLEAALTRASMMDRYLEVHTGREIIDDIKAMMQDAFDLGFKAAGGSIHPITEIKK